jgi:hypothetical protein
MVSGWEGRIELIVYHSSEGADYIYCIYSPGMCQYLSTPRRIAVRRAKRRAVGGRWRQQVTVGLHINGYWGLGDSNRPIPFNKTCCTCAFYLFSCE